MNPCFTVAHMSDGSHAAFSGGSRIAFFGGSFDPPHRGHLAIARAAQTALGLDTVLFAPVGAQPLKPSGSTASFEDRLAMTRLAIENQPEFALSLADAPSTSGTPNYTIDTLIRLRAELPANGALFCLMGADSFLGLRKWHRGAAIPFIAPLIVASRPGEPIDKLTHILPAGLAVESDLEAAKPHNGVDLQSGTLRNAAGATTPFYLLSGLHIDISASQIRQQVRAAAGRLTTGHDLLPDAVSQYIAAHRLYT